MSALCFFLLADAFSFFKPQRPSRYSHFITHQAVIAKG
ncbi:hypothetical protein BN4901_1187 [Citrobacter europaeus]|uniref:Uncharacterized protein n=1 Tax=Citrobacter europaeus TaxID=1914243 RepID=A0ABY0JLA1_9ENTR|nr:hypothetical protein CIP106467_3137 [Citrobacter europaeus]SBW23692.1 hypothetical protein BN4901_1187 [Citrobacter europaeus]